MPSWADRGHMSHKDTLAGCRVMGIEHVECKDGNITKGLLPKRYNLKTWSAITCRSISNSTEKKSATFSSGFLAMTYVKTQILEISLCFKSANTRTCLTENIKTIHIFKLKCCEYGTWPEKHQSSYTPGCSEYKKLTGPWPKGTHCFASIV